MKAILNQEKFNHVVLQKEKNLNLLLHPRCKKRIWDKGCDCKKSLENLRTTTNLLKVYINQKKIDHTIQQKGKKILTYFCT